ncbi:MAG: ABC transporter ATP-binding protein [Planctomycetota bacterium]|nr:ABC transporter ATP-binding protein [Planctomycetota bacterium]
MSEVISVNNVSKRFGKKTVLDNISLKVPSGVVFALLGENGAGKSTLIRSMLGYTKLNSGSISVCGLDPLKKPLEIRRQVGYVSDAPGLYEWMTVAQAGWYASGFYPDGFLRNYAARINEFQLPADSKIRDLSKGMRAKVALSLAMAFDPELLIMDEPTSGLDPLVRRSFLESMIDRAAAGQTVFLSSHQIQEVERVADWVAILHQGKLQIVSPLEELKSSVTILDLSLRDPLLALPDEMEQLEILHRIQKGRTIHMMVRGFTSAIELGLSKHANLFEIKAMRPNLEELYLGFTQPYESIQARERNGQGKSNQTEVA